MSDSFGVTGLTTKTLNELIAELENDFQNIYGSDINTDPNSPDGQLLNILAQQGVDLRELLTLINANFDPDQAEGTVLDQRVGINGIERLAGSYTKVEIEVTATAAGTLVGLDAQSDELNPTVENLFTVKDAQGNLCYLLTTAVISGAGTSTLVFRAAALGTVEIPANTMVTVSTVVAFVSTVNNPDSAFLVGSNEESDTALKIRRRKSIAISSVGLVQSVEAALLALTGVTAVFVYENDTTSTDANGVPAHTIWAIVEGGDEAEIANVLYTKRSLGCGMYGAITYDIVRPSGQIFVAKWDIPINQNLWIKFNLDLPGGVVDTTFIKNQIVDNVFWGVGQDAVNDIVTVFVKSLNTNYRVTEVLLSDDGVTYTEIVSAILPTDRYVNAVARITIT